MNERELVTALQDGSLPPQDFNHYNHVRVAWHTLRQMPLRDAAHHFRDLLLGYVRKLGAEDKFHLTLTFAFIHLIHQRMKTSRGCWSQFVEENRDLFDDAQSLIGRYYSGARLMSLEARRGYLGPDLKELPG